MLANENEINITDNTIHSVHTMAIYAILISRYYKTLWQRALLLFVIY